MERGANDDEGRCGGDLVIGGGFRALPLELDAAAVDRVRGRFRDALGAEGVDHFDARTVVALGTAGPGAPCRRFSQRRFSWRCLLFLLANNLQ